MTAATAEALPQTPATAPVAVRLPRINLLPPEIAVRQTLRKVQAGLGGGVLAALGVVLALQLAAAGSVQEAQATVTTAEAEHTALVAQAGRFRDVTDVYTRTAAAQAMLVDALSDEVRYSRFLEQFSTTLPDHVWVTSLTFTQARRAGRHRQRPHLGHGVQPRRRGRLAGHRRRPGGLRRRLPAELDRAAARGPDRRRLRDDGVHDRRGPVPPLRDDRRLTMTRTNWVAAGLLAVLAVLAGGWFLLVSPTRAEATTLREQAQAQSDTNDRVRTQLQVLQAQADALPEQQRLLDEVAGKIPGEVQMPQLLRALTDVAEASDVEFVSLVPGIPAPAAALAAPATTTADGTAAAPAAPGPTSGTAGTLLVVPITINVAGAYHQIEHYLSELEDLPRALRVSGLAMVPGPNPVAPVQEGNVDDGRSLVTVITGSVYVAGGQASSTPGTSGSTVPDTAGPPSALNPDSGS